LGRTPILARLYRASSTAGQRALLESSAPITTAIARRRSGKLEVTQTANRWIPPADHALMRMLNFSLSTRRAVTLMFASPPGWRAPVAAAPGE